MSDAENKTEIQVIPTLTTKLVAVQKRGGETVPFDSKKIFDAIRKAVAVTNEISDVDVAKITQNVLNTLDAKFTDRVPSVEQIQETVIQALMDAKAYEAFCAEDK